MRKSMDTQHASDVPHALVSVLLQLAHRPIDHPHDYASRLIDRKRKLAEISLLGEDDFMSLRASTCSDSELDTDDSESESDESCAAPSEVSASGARSEHSPLQIPLQTAPESESECEIENVPHPLFLEELKRGNHSIVPEEFLVEDVVAMLLGLDADIYPRYPHPFYLYTIRLWLDFCNSFVSLRSACANCGICPRLFVWCYRQ